MMKTHFLIFALFVSLGSFAQITFENVLSPPFGNFLDVDNSTATFLDVDGDNDLDLFLTGRDLANDRRAILYLNTGQGGYKQYELVGIPFLEISGGSVDFADVDGDSDEDLFITGSTQGGAYSCSIFLNEGNGVFLYDLANTFTPLAIGESRFVDIDTDGDFDLLSVGFDGSGTNGHRCILSINNGSGNFTETNPIGVGMSHSTLDLGDIDNDGDFDVLISGRGQFGTVTHIYQNTGNGSLSLLNGTPFVGVENGAAKYIDANGDGNLDVLVYGDDGSGQHVAKLYFDNGSNTYSEASTFNHVGLSYCAADINDVDLDGDIDFVISGSSDTGYVTLLYMNDGNGIFSASSGTSFEQMSNGTVDFHDINEDGFSDVLITGRLNPIEQLTCLYINDGLGNFHRMIGNPLEPLNYASSAFADIDGDLDLDLLTVGSDEYGDRSTILYRNDGTGYYTRQDTTPFEDVIFGDVLFVDVDADNDQDLFLTGQGFTNGIGSFAMNTLYLNDGNGNYTAASNQPFVGVVFSALSAGDLDGDLDLDILVTGLDSAGQRSTRLYLNDGFGQFITSTNNGLIDYSNGDIQLGDIDNDGDLDVLLGGYSSGSTAPHFYLNDGSANFTMMNGTSFPASTDSEFALFDADGDSDLDVFFSGVQSSIQSAELYTNDGLGNFSLSTNTFETFLLGSTVEAIDLEGDGDLDLLVSAQDVQPQKPIAYINDGAGNFSMFDFPNLPYFKENIRMADIDGDLDPDLLTLGKRQTDILVAEMYRNVNCASSFDTLSISTCEPYTAPSGAILSVSGNYQDSVVVGLGCMDYYQIDLNVTSVDTAVSNINGVLSSNATSATYQWINCSSGAVIPGETSQTYLPDTTGSYAVIITVNSCVDTSACVYVNVASIPIGTDDMVRVYPNPVSEKLIVELSSEFMDKDIELISIQGISIIKQKIHSTSLEIPVESIGEGLYFILIDNKVLTSPIIKT